MFTDEQKKIFRYFDGSAWVFGDPLALKRRLSRALDGDPNRYLAALAPESGDEEAFQATEKVIQAVRVAFDMAAFDRNTGGGAKDQHCLDALAAFIDYIHEQKKNGPTLPIASQPLAPSGDSPRTMEPLSGSC